MKKTIAVIGGTQEQTFKKIGQRYGVEVVFHSGKGGNKKNLKNVVKKADCVVLLLGAVGHVSQNIVKVECKKQNKNLLFQSGFGASNAIRKCVEQLDCTA